MKKMIVYLALFFAYCRSDAQGSTQAVIFASARADTYLKGNEIFYWIDSARTNTVSTVVRSSRFIPAKGSIPNFGYTANAIWIRLNIHNDLPERLWNILIENPLLDMVEAYSVERDVPIKIFRSTNQDKKYQNFIVPLPSNLHTIYIRILSHQPVYLPIKVIDVGQFVSDRHSSDLLHSCYLGVILSLVLYNLFMYFSLRDRAHLYYSLYELCIGLMFACITGYFTQIGGPELLNNIFLFKGLSTAFAFLFLIKLLRFPNHRRIIKMSVLFSICFIVLCMVSIVFPQIRIQWGIRFSCFSAGLFFIAVGLMSHLNSNYKPARFFILAWSVFVAGSLVSILKDMNILPYTSVTQHAAQVCSLIEAILLSITLADRIGYYQKKKEDAEKREAEYVAEFNKIVERQNLILQATVRERTEKLEELNRVKDNFFSIIAYDLRYPLKSLADFASQIAMKASVLSMEDIIGMSRTLNASVRNAINLTDGLLTWARSQMRIDEFVMEKVNVEEAVEEVFARFASQSFDKSVRLVHDSLNGLQVIADKGQFIQILNNLISNAIKFTHNKGTVVVSGARKNERVELKIADDGVGMTNEQIENLYRINIRRSTLGTEGELGNGLGLILIREFIKRNDGTIEVASEEGRGTSFTISLQSPAIEGTVVGHSQGNVVL